MMNQVQLRSYDNSWYQPGGSFAKRMLWMFVGQPFFASKVVPSSGLRGGILRAFGAQVGEGVVIKPGVKVKYPWHLILGDDCWIGEDCWIDNLTTVRIGPNACISQGAYLCTGNHDWSDPQFGLRIEAIELEEGAWAGAKAILMPGTILGSHAIVGAGSVVKGFIPAMEIHAGNPATKVRVRTIRSVGAAVREVAVS